MPGVRLITLVAAIAITASWPSWAASVIDQSNPLANLDGGLEVHPAGDGGVGQAFVAQTFTVGKTGRLTRVDLPVTHHRCTPVGQLKVEIVRTVGGVPGTEAMIGAALDAQDVPPDGTAMVTFDFGAGIEVTAGDVLGIAATTDATYPCNYAWHGETPDDYDGGAAWCHYADQYQVQCVRDMGFQTWVSDTQPGDDPPVDDPPGDGENDDDQGDNRDDQGGNRDDQRGNDDGHGQDQDHAGGKSTVTAGAMQWTTLLLALLGAGLRRRRPRTTR